MGNLQLDDDDDENAIDDEEYPDDDEADWNLDPASIECPYCGGDIVEDTQRCPHCEKYISKEDGPSGRGLWVVIAIIVLVGLLVFGLFWWL